jgi:hypothetical protein
MTERQPFFFAAGLAEAFAEEPFVAAAFAAFGGFGLL